MIYLDVSTVTLGGRILRYYKMLCDCGRVTWISELGALCPGCGEWSL